MSHEEIVIHLIETWLGFSAEKIPESNKISPDFLVSGYGERYLIELKTKSDDEEVITRIRTKLESGEVAEHSDTTARKNTISKIINDAAKQVSSIGIEVDYKLIWLMAVDEHQEMKFSQFKSSLYGASTIFDLDSLNTITCYYFDFNDLFRTREVLDGAIISTTNKATICINTLSKNYRSFKESSLVSKFGAAYCDPIEEEKNGLAMLIDEDLDRRDTGHLLKYLREKYGRDKLQNMEMSYFSGEVLVTSDDIA